MSAVRCIEANYSLLEYSKDWDEAKLWVKLFESNNVLGENSKPWY